MQNFIFFVAIFFALLKYKKMRKQSTTEIMEKI